MQQKIMPKRNYTSKSKKKKVLFISNNDAHFYNHLLPLATHAINNNYEVLLCSNFHNHRKLIEKHNIKTRNYYLSRDSINPINEIRSFIGICKAIITEKPDIIHNFTIKPILYGTIASLFSSRKTLIINNFLGLGYVFTKNNLINNLIKSSLFKSINFISILRKVKVIVQNNDDKDLLSKYFSCKTTIHTQCSVGVDTNTLTPFPEPKGTVVFALVARMLKDKGVVEFIKAANLCQKEGVNAEFWLVGEPDPGNKATLTVGEIKALITNNSVKYCGFQDIEKIWQRAYVSVLPSYREGMSRSLLEAGAYCRAIIAAKAPGANDLIEDNANGLLVETKDHIALYNAIRFLLDNPDKRQGFAKSIRKKIEKEFDNKYIVKKMLEFYM
jgi:glycosyltransferase involved in cell wall biosynthesis